VSLKYTDPERARLSIVNTAGGTPPEEGTGLGSRLIQAFARQLNGTLEVKEEDGMYSLTLDFPVPKVEKAVIDY
jgi:two-component sensor histidine kinase